MFGMKVILPIKNGPGYVGLSRPILLNLLSRYWGDESTVYFVIRRPGLS